MTAMADAWELEVDIAVAWGDMDAFQHVNNTVYLRWFETARIAWLDKVEFPESDGKLGPILRTSYVEYLSPVTYPDKIRVKVRTKKIGNRSVTLEYEVTSEAQKTVVAKGDTVVVLIDYEKGAAVPLPDDARARIARTAGSPGAG
jgi:acyl-CoA thioester hydrolase